MPGFPWLAKNTLDGKDTAKKMRVMNTLISSTCSKCETYSEDTISAAQADVKGKTELDALIAYLQELGTAIKTRR
jgi:cytochrome c oxidase cbb3-type subunit 2